MSDSCEPRWLDDEQMAAWMALQRVLVWLPAALDTQLQRDAQLSHFEYQVLAMLSAAPEHTAHMHVLAAQANSSASRLSHAVGRLERQGWIERCADPAHRRFVLARLTEAGWDKLVATAPGHVAAVQECVFEQLNPTQVAQLRRIAERIGAVVVPDGPTVESPG